MIKKLKVFFLILLFSYSAGMTYFALNEINPKNLVAKYIGQPTSDYVEDTEREFKFIRGLLDEYYIINPDDGPSRKFEAISKISSSSIDSNFLNEFKNTLNLYAKNKGKRSYNLKKVLKNKENKSTYWVFLKMETQFPKEEKESFLMEVNLTLTIDPMKNENYQLSKWSERVLTRSPEILTSKKVLVDVDAYTELRLPCNFQYVGPVKNHEGVEVNLESRNKIIKFKPKEPLSQVAEYRASCKDRVFILDLENDDQIQTLYHAFKMNDGQKKYKKLTEREKLIRILESNMDVKVQR